MYGLLMLLNGLTVKVTVSEITLVEPMVTTALEFREHRLLTGMAALILMVMVILTPMAVGLVQTEPMLTQQTQPSGLTLTEMVFPIKAEKMTVQTMPEPLHMTEKAVLILMVMDIQMLTLDGHLPMAPMYSIQMPPNGMIPILMATVMNQPVI